MGQRPHPWPTVQDALSAHLGADDDRKHREIPRFRMLRSIGPVCAGKMVRAFGAKVFDVIEADPDRLREVTGIGPMRAKRIADAWAEQKIVRDFLHSHGVGTARAVRIFKTYSVAATRSSRRLSER